MNDSTNTLNNQLANEYLERENNDKQVLALLLNRFLEKKDQILVQKTEMGWYRGLCRF